MALFVTSMTAGPRRSAGVAAVLWAAVAVGGCGPDAAPDRVDTPPDSSPVPALLESGEEVVLAPEANVTTPAGRRFEALIRKLDGTARSGDGVADATVDYPLEDSLFPPGFVPPVAGPRTCWTRVPPPEALWHISQE